MAKTKKTAAKKSPAKAAAKPAKKSTAKPAKPAKLDGKALTAKIASLMGDVAVQIYANKIDAAVELVARARVLATSKKTRTQVQTDCQVQGNRLLWSQKWKPAIAIYEAGAEVFRDGDDSRLTAEMLNESGFALLQRQKLDEAEQRIRRALDLHEKAKRLEGVASAIYYLSSVVFERGDIEQSVELARQAVAKSAEGNDRRGGVFHSYALARALFERGQTREAEEISRKAQPIAQELGLGAVEGNLVNMIANVALDDHRLDEAQKQYERAIELFRAANLKNHEAITISNIGNLLWDRGDLEEALERYQEAIKLHGKSKDDRSSAIGLTARAGVFTDLGRFAEAEKDLEAALAIMMRIGHERRVSFVRSGFARLAEARGELEVARAHYAETEMSLEVAGDAIEVGRMLYAAAGVEAELGDPEGAEALLVRAATLDPASLSPDDNDPAHLGKSEKRAGREATRAIRELAIGRIEAARAKRATGEEARAFRFSAQARLEAITRAKDSLMVRSSEVRRVASRLAAQLALALPPPPAKFAGPCTGTGWKVDKKGKFRGKLVIATEAGMFVATGFLAWDDRKAEVELTGPATAKPVLRGKMTVTKDPATWHLRVELERTDTELRGRFIEVYQGDDHEDEDEHATEKEMCTFTWPAV